MATAAERMARSRARRKVRERERAALIGEAVALAREVEALREAADVERGRLARVRIEAGERMEGRLLDAIRGRALEAEAPQTPKALEAPK